MSDQDTQDTGLPTVSELDTLKFRAEQLGIKFHPSIGVDSLRAKVNAKLNDQPDPDEAAAPSLVKGAGAASTAPAAEESDAQRRNRLKKESNVLVRVNVGCMNPAKKEWEGEIFTVGNSVIGTHRKFVPFNTEDGYHIPAAILQVMQDRKCQIFVTRKSKNGGPDKREGKLIKEFNIEILPPLSQSELNELARRQAAAGQAV